MSAPGLALVALLASASPAGDEDPHRLFEKAAVFATQGSFEYAFS